MTSADVDLGRMLHRVGGGRAAVLGVWTTPDVSVQLGCLKCKHCYIEGNNVSLRARESASGFRPEKRWGNKHFASFRKRVLIENWGRSW